MSKVKLMSLKKMDASVGLKYAYTDFSEVGLHIQGKSKDTASGNPTLALVNEEGQRFRVGIGAFYNACLDASCEAITIEEEAVYYDTSVKFDMNAEEGEYAITQP